MSKWEIKTAANKDDVDKLLFDGWEPYAVSTNGFGFIHFFRRKQSDKRADFWERYHVRLPSQRLR